MFPLTWTSSHFTYLLCVRERKLLMSLHRSVFIILPPPHPSHYDLLILHHPCWCTAAAAAATLLFDDLYVTLPRHFRGIRCTFKRFRARQKPKQKKKGFTQVTSKCTPLRVNCTNFRWISECTFKADLNLTAL